MCVQVTEEEDENVDNPNRLSTYMQRHMSGSVSDVEDAEARRRSESAPPAPGSFSINQMRAIARGLQLNVSPSSRYVSLKQSQPSRGQ